MKNRKNIILVCAFLATFVVGFLGGMEYKAYQIRSAIGDAFIDISKNFSETNKTASSASTQKPEAANGLTSKVSFETTKKGFSDKDFQTQNLFTFKFTNNTDKNIDGVQGTVWIMDLFGNLVKEVTISYDEGIKAGESKLYSAGIYYNQFVDEDIKLRQTDLAKLKFDWQVDTIIYEDGTRE